jgi:hypothetical protein
MAIRQAQYCRGGASMRSRRTVQASRKTVEVPARATTPMGTSVPPAGRAPRHQTSEVRPSGAIREPIRLLSASKYAEAARERKWSWLRPGDWTSGKGSSGTARTTTPSRM